MPSPSKIAHGNAKVTPEQITEIRASTDAQHIIADRFGISQSQVSRIKNGRCWEDWREMADRLAEALRLTQEYCGDKLLPSIEGWSWFDALEEYKVLSGKERHENS